jgi:hypothetical protein
LNTKYKILKQLGASNIQINTLQTTVKFSKWEIVFFIYIYIYIWPMFQSSRHSSQKTRVQNYDETGRWLGHQGTERSSYPFKLGGLFRPSISLDERSLIWALKSFNGRTNPQHSHSGGAVNHEVHPLRVFSFILFFKERNILLT